MSEGMSEVFTLHKGTVPLLVSMPHIGTEIPAELKGGYTDEALRVEDTDWHLHLLYNFLPRWAPAYCGRVIRAT
jgi:N-formylglutamate deformylase